MSISSLARSFDILLNDMTDNGTEIQAENNAEIEIRAENNAEIEIQAENGTEILTQEDDRQYMSYIELVSLPMSSLHNKGG